MRHPVLAVLLLAAGTCLGQDPLDLVRLKDFRAYRSSSNNPDLTSNDDSLRPIPGETVTLADLEGPGVVNHIWLTIAANEYGWPRLLRLRVYYDHSSTASLYYHVDWEKRKQLPPGTAYFHAWYKQEIPAQAGKPYTVLDVRGRGHYV